MGDIAGAFAAAGQDRLQLTALLQQLSEAETSAAGPSDLAFERLSFEEAVRTIEAGVARWGPHSGA